MKEERDDALSQIYQAECRAERFCQERDEARKICRELNELVAYGLGQSGEPWSIDAMRQAADAIQKAKSLEESK